MDDLSFSPAATVAGLAGDLAGSVAGFGSGSKHDIAFSFWAAGLADDDEDDGADSFGSATAAVAAGSAAAAMATTGDLGGLIEDLLSPALLVSAFSVDEAIFGLTRIEVMLVSKRSDIDLEALIDAPATLTLHHKYLPQLRHFSGIVVEAERGNSGHHRTSYRVVLLPSLARLDHGSDCRILCARFLPSMGLRMLSGVWGLSTANVNIARNIVRRI